MVGKPNLPEGTEKRKELKGAARTTPGLNALDQEREASMADEGGAAGAVMETESSQDIPPKTSIEAAYEKVQEAERELEVAQRIEATASVLPLRGRAREAALARPKLLAVAVGAVAFALGAFVGLGAGAFAGKKTRAAFRIP